MPGGYAPLTEGQSLRESQITIAGNFEALRTSSNDGDARPTDPLVGQTNFRNIDRALSVFDNRFTYKRSWGNVPVTMIFRITHEAFTETGNGVAEFLELLPSGPTGQKILSIRARTVVQFAGGGISTLRLDVGDGTVDTQFLNNYNAIAAPSNTNFTDNVPTMATRAAHAINAKFTPDGGANLADLTAGEMEISIAYTRMEN